MDPTAVLTPQIVDLGLSLGLLRSNAGTVEFDSTWFSAPGPKIATALADDDRRQALVRFVESVHGDGPAPRVGEVTLLQLFDAHDLVGASAPHLTISISLDDTHDTYVEVGLAVEHSTTTPETHTELLVPLYRTGKRVGNSVAPVAEHFAMAAGSSIRLSSTISTAGAADGSGFDLAGVSVAVELALPTGAPAVEIALKGLRLPGSAAPIDLTIGGPGASLEESLLTLVLGIVRASAGALGGGGAAAMAALDLIGLGPDGDLPPLDLDALASQGVAALQTWFATTLNDATARTAWLGALRGVLGGSLDGEELVVALGGGPVELRVSVAAAPGPGGHLVVTPRIALQLATVLGGGAGAVRLGANAVIDVLTVDLAEGSLRPLPSAELHVSMTGDGAKLLPSGPVTIGTAQLGVGFTAGALVPLLRLLDVDTGGAHHDVLDLSSADAVVAAAGEIAGDLLATALDAVLGTAAPAVKALLGVAPPAGVDPLDVGALFAHPLAALLAWWKQLVTAHASLVPDVLAQLRDLVAHDTLLLVPVSGTGTVADPWSIAIVDRLSLDAWVDAGTLVIAPTLGFRVDDLAGGCTVVESLLRAELAAIDLDRGSVSLLRSAELSAGMRGRGADTARLALGPIALVAERLGVAARWTAAGGFAVSLDAPGLAADLGDGTTQPLALPTGSDLEAMALAEIEQLVGVLAASNRSGWLHDVVDLFGWTFEGPQDAARAGASPHRLHLDALVADPQAELTRWVAALLADEDIVARATSGLARLLTGSSRGLGGALTGRGTFTDPWLLPFGTGTTTPALSIALGPDGPRLTPSTTTDALQTWRPGLPGLPAAGLAQAVLDEANAGDDTAALARGRAGLGVGLAALVDRVTGTDVLVAPPPIPVDGVTALTHEAMAWNEWADLPVAAALGSAPPAGAAVVRIAIGSTAGNPPVNPWPSAPAGRLLDLSAPGLTPESFTVDAPDAGEWFVVLATRADAALGTGDPSGVLGQAARLRRVISALGAARPVVLLAVGGAGHAARVAADAEVAVTDLVTLGTPWSAVSFDTARNGTSGDALRLLEALLPDVDASEPDDPDLALGRALVQGLRSAAVQADIEAPRPELAVRAGLTVRAWFGALAPALVERATTAIVAAGLSGRAQARAAASLAPATDVHVGVRLPVPSSPPTSGHGVVVEGGLSLGLSGGGLASGHLAAQPTVEVHVVVSDSDGWLLGGPGTVPSGSSQPVEVRFLEARVTLGIGDGPAAAGAARAELILHEVAALGARRDRIVVRPDASVEGTIEALPFLPEARVVVAGVVNRLRASEAGSAAARLGALLDAIGLSTSTGLVPDALTHLLHDPGAFCAPVLAAAPGRAAVAEALVGLVPGAALSGDVVTVTEGPAIVTLDLATRRVGVQAASSEGVLPWSLNLDGIGGASMTGAVTIGAPGSNGAAIRLDLAPFRASLVSADAAGQSTSVAVWPTTDLAGLTAFARAALPAEAVRLVLDAVRGLDATVAAGVEALTGALGVLGAPDASGFRPVLAPVGLFRDPGGWLRASVLGVSAGEQVERVTDLFEAVKPFVGLGGTPRGTWPVVDGLALTVASGSTGATIALAIDPTAWAGGAGRAPFAAGATVGLTLTPSGAPRPSVELFVGVPEAAPTGNHRRAVHVTFDAGSLQAFLRPTTGADIALFPNPAGLGALLSAGIDQLLPMVLDALARLSGDATRTQIGQLVSAVGRGLDVVADPTDLVNPATFDGTKLHALADDPAGRLEARAVALVAQFASAADPLLAQLPGAPHAVMATGKLVVTALGVTLTFDPNPISVTVEGSVSGLDVVGTVEASFTASAGGLDAWAFGVGPAVFDLAGVRLRPLLRGAREGPSGWEVDLGLSLDDQPIMADGHHELFARWRQSDGLALVARSHTGTTDVDVSSATDPATVATFAADATLELLGNFIIQLDAVDQLLNTPVGSSSVRAILKGSVLDETDDHRLRPAPVSHARRTVLVLATNLAAALPDLALPPFKLTFDGTGGHLAVGLDVLDEAKGLELNPGGDVVLSIVTDATWIEPPSGVPPTPGIQLDLITVGGGDDPTVTLTPGIAVNGVGLRIAAGNGPLLDAGLRIEALAVHVFGSLQPSSGGVAVSGGVQVELDGLAVPLGAGGGDNAVAQGVMHDAGGSGSPPTPKFSPGLAVQSHHGANGVAVSLRAGSGDGPWYLPIQRSFGPVYLEQIGLGVGYQGNPPTSARRLEWIAVSLDGSVSLFGISASVDKLRLTYYVNDPFFSASSWKVDLDGFAIASSVGGLTLAGALRKSPLSPPLQGVEYLGMLKIGFSGYGVDLFGGYAHPTGPSGSFASFFAFGALHAPLGGPPAFFITGIGLGFGINRQLTPPTMDTITTNPFLVAMKALGPAPDPMVQLEQMRRQIQPAQGQYWVAAGISFTSFVLISGEVVVTVEFGDGLDITLLGLARAELPAPELTLVSIELALLARFSTKEGMLLVQAQLTENSWLLMKSVRLTGGFAFATWWKGPNAGQFVVTMGGYHPKFHHDGYPSVPRLGLRWQPIDNISVIGESYFALCSEALMAGTRLEVSAHFGPAHARLTFGGDGIVFFDPFWFEVSVYAEISAGIRLWLLFGTVDVEVSLGAEVTVSGPPIFVTGHFDVCGFEVPFEFGDKGDEADRAITAGQFRDKYLRSNSDAQVIQSALVRGAVPAGQRADGQQQKVPDGSATNPFLVIPEFQLMLITTAPAIDMALTHQGSASKTLHVAAPDAGVAPMLSHTLSSNFHAELSKLDQPTTFTLGGVSLAARPDAAFPRGVWGEPQNKQSPSVPAGDIMPASDGYTMSTVLPDPVGAPAIDYHQVELPFAGRKPLPFVTNTVNANARVAAASQLKALADAIRPADGDVELRFNYAARLLDAGGYGSVGVAALRGERAAIPGFGSLADDLVLAPGVVSSKVDPVVVDRNPPAKPFVAPIVKALLRTPISNAVAGAPHTSVKDPSPGVRMAVPTIESMRANVARLGPASLLVRPGIPGAPALRGRISTGPRPTTVIARGVAPVTRLTTAPVAVVANARPDDVGGQRLRSMSEELPNGTTLHEGELAVIAVASRPSGSDGERMAVSGGPVRVIALAAGGNVLFDNLNTPVLSTSTGSFTVELPVKTERVVIAAPGQVVNVGGTFDGWYSGQSLPLVGWDMAVGAGVVVTFGNHKAPANRERRDGGWGNTSELARAARVVTRFDAPVRTIAVAVDDTASPTARNADAPVGRAAEQLDMRLVGADRVLGPDGQPLPPAILVQGLRTVLLFQVQPTPPADATNAGATAVDPNVLVVVEGTRNGFLAGVAGSTGTVEEMTAAFTATGFDAAIAAVLPGGTGTRTVTWISTAAPQAPRPPRQPRSPRRSNATRTNARARTQKGAR